VTVLTIDHVYKSFNDVHAVQDLSLELPQGEIFGLLGPNGAGKTTTIRMIMDIIIPDRGKILIMVNLTRRNNSTRSAICLKSVACIAR